jgi:hypothetical protein
LITINMMIKTFVFLMTVFVFLTQPLKAEDILQLTAEGTSSSEVPAKARSDSLKEAINKACLQVISQLIGDAKLEKNMPVIRSKVLSQTSRFVPFYKASEPTKRGEDTVTSVSLKLSISSLRSVLSQEGLLYQSDGPATVLPIIRFAERRENGRLFRWWMEEATAQNAFLRDQSRMVLGQLDAVFRKQNFYQIDPVSAHYVQWMPEPYRIETLSLEDLMWMGEFFKAQMVVHGDAVLEPGPTTGSVKLNVKLVAYHSSNGRVIAEVTRTFENSAADWDLSVQQVLRRGFGEIGRDLGTQVFEEWTRGTFGATLLKLALRGSFQQKDMDSFKQQILSKLGDIKTIRERRIETGMTTFEIDAAGGLTSLVKRLESTPFEGFKVSVDSLESDKVTLRWSKVGN